MSDPRVTSANVPEDLPGNGDGSASPDPSPTEAPHGADAGSLDYAPNTDSLLPTDSRPEEGEEAFNQIEHKDL